MFDISWGEIAVLGAVGVAVTGKRDLPRACFFVGNQLGRIVGLLQGARARADRFAHHNELKALQNELRSGLRELDQVKTELAVAASTRGVMGRGLGATTLSANRKQRPTGGSSGSGTCQTIQDWKASPPVSTPPRPSLVAPTMVSSSATAETGITSHPSHIGGNDIPTGSSSSSSSSNNSNHAQPELSLSDFDFHVTDESEKNRGKSAPSTALNDSVEDSPLSSVAQSERAVMEEEWTKQGIGFRAKAEQGSWIGDSSGDEMGNLESMGTSGMNDTEASVVDTTRATGSELLEHLERQCLIFDQYDRVVGEQEAAMEERIERIQNERRRQEEPQTKPGREPPRGSTAR